MTPIHRYHLEQHQGPYESWPLTSRLVMDEVITRKHVPGYLIEAQYETRLGDLLVTSYDCPFEESNSFVLLDASQEIIARAALAVPYGSYLLHAHWPVDEGTLALHYHGDVFYRLSLVAARGWFRKKPRLKLQRVDAWQDDPRMRESHEHLKRQLSDIEAARASDEQKKSPS